MNTTVVINQFNLLYKFADATGGFPIRTTTLTMPVYDGTVKLLPNTHFAAAADNYIHFLFFGETGSYGGTFEAQVIYWNKMPGNNSIYQNYPAVTNYPVILQDIWIPEIVYNVSGTLGIENGIAQTPIDNHHYFAETLTITGGTVNMASGVIMSPTNSVASLTLPINGTQIIEVAFDCISATAMNAIYKTY